jgi:hypothetical protein
MRETGGGVRVVTKKQLVAEVERANSYPEHILRRTDLNTT